MPETIPSLDITANLLWDEHFPHPQWELMRPIVESQVPAEQQFEAWSGLARQWLEKAAEVFPKAYRVSESARFLLVAPNEYPHAAALKFAEGCCDFLVQILSGIAHPPGPGKLPIVVLPNRQWYYHYLAWFYPDGKHGESSGVHIRDAYPHVALWGMTLTDTDSTIAHELTHACLMPADLPLWMEEGLTQIVEHDMTGRGLLQVTREIADDLQTFWNRDRLQSFWRGEGYGKSGKIQLRSYQLSEILMRLLLADYGPRWFGFDRRKQRQLLGFLREAKSDDFGQAAAKQHLGCGLDEVAAKFLGSAKSPPAD